MKKNKKEVIVMFTPGFYRCDTCGNVIWLISNSGSPVVCCGASMMKLDAGESDGAADRHTPMVEEHGGTIRAQIGSVLHPALSGHHIEWIALHTESGMFFKEIPVGKVPVANFSGYPGRPLAVYSYCNLHGLWKYEILSSVEQ